MISVIMYFLCLCIAVVSFVCIYTIIKDKKKKIWIVLPVYMELIIILVLCTQQLVYFGLLGIIGVIPLIKIEKNSDL